MKITYECSRFFSFKNGYIKTLLVMKMTIALLLFAILQTFAKGTNAQLITLSKKNATIEVVFKELNRQTGVEFVYDNRLLDKARRIDIAVENATLDAVLKICFNDQSITYVIEGNIVVVKEFTVQKNISVSAPPEATEEAVGFVKDNNGKPISGVSVVNKISGKGTSTAADGSFKIEVKKGDIIEFSFVGYIKQTVSIKSAGSTAVVNITLIQENKELTDIIVTGYSKQSKRDVTGAVSTISADIVAQTPSTDVTSVLQGRVAGVTVDGQGGPGNQQVVRIRGIGTLGDNDPLYVIDGVQTKGGLNLVNQNDIETITVLKDAASAALYGARGGNGVIVITTKRGKNGTPRLEYNSYVGYEFQRKLPGIVTPQQYADAYWGYLKNAGLPLISSFYGSGSSPVLPDYVIQKGSPSDYGVLTGDPAANPALYNLLSYRILKTNKNGTNWFDEVFNPALTQSHQLALSGATDKSNYALTLNYTNNNGTLVNSFFKRYSVRVNTEFKIKPWLRLGENIQFAYSNGNTVNDKTDQNVVATLYSTSPLLPVYDINGHLSGTKNSPILGETNPYTNRVNSKNSKGYNARVLGAAYVEIEPIKNLVFQSKITIDYSPFQNRYFQDTMPQEAIASSRNQFGEFGGYFIEYRTINKISYDVNINNTHKISAFAAYEASEAQSRSLGGSNYGLFSSVSGFQYFGTGDPSTLIVNGGGDKSTYISLFGNLNYGFRDKYLASFTIRRDGSSKFGPQSRYGTFPSVSIGWRVSGEKFMDKITWINDFKLRAAVGTSGNDGSLPTGATINQFYTNPQYTYYDLGGTNNTAMQGFALRSIGNPGLQWEVNKTTNLGFDASLFNNSVTVSFNWFKRLTDKLLYQPPVTALSGDAQAPYKNIMNFTNKGIELELGYNSPKRGSFSYNANFNIATYRNKVNYINGDPSAFILGGLYRRAIPLSRSVAGRPISQFFGYVQEGIFQSAEEVTKHATQPGFDTDPAKGVGHFRFKDINGDGVINDADRTYIGSPHPKFSYGLNLGCNYKNFDASVFIQGVYGNKIFNYWRAYSRWPGAFGVGSLDTWSPENKGASLPIYSTLSDDILDAKPSSFFVEDGSYLRVKNIQLGYTFPLIKGISKLRVYVQAFNLLTVTKYTGIDPEVNNGTAQDAGIDFGGIYPISNKILFGVNLTL